MKKKLYVILLLIFVLPMILNGCNSSNYSESRFFRSEYQPGINLILKNKTGNVRIENWLEDYIYIETYFYSRASSVEEAKKVVNLANININSNKDKLYIEAVYPDYMFNYSLQIDYYIKIPEEFSGEIITSTGDIIIDRIVGNLFVETNTGRCSINSIDGELKARLGTDNLEIGYLQGIIDVITSTGEVWGNLELRPGSINNITTSTGDIEINLGDRASSKLTAITSTGNIYLNGLKFEEKIITNLGYGGELNLITSTGDIVVNY